MSVGAREPVQRNPLTATALAVPARWISHQAIWKQPHEVSYPSVVRVSGFHEEIEVSNRSTAAPFLVYYLCD